MIAISCESDQIQQVHSSSHFILYKQFLLMYITKLSLSSIINALSICQYSPHLDLTYAVISHCPNLPFMNKRHFFPVKSVHNIPIQLLGLPAEEPSKKVFHILYRLFILLFLLCLYSEACEIEKFSFALTPNTVKLGAILFFLSPIYIHRCFRGTSWPHITPKLEP